MSRTQQEHFVASLSETTVGVVDAVDEEAPPASLWLDAWRKLRRRPLFYVSAIILLVVFAVALFPHLFTSVPADAYCDLTKSLGKSQSGHLLGFDKQGCDIYSRIVYGARPSVLVGVLTTVLVILLGGTMGALAGYLGKWTDSLSSRLADIFFAVPLILGSIVILQSFRDSASVWGVVLVMGMFGWPQLFRITRGAVMEVKNSDFITASKALGVSKPRILLRHIVPNSLAPIIVTATVSLGTYIVAEATLSFLGVGLPQSMHSWGEQIALARNSIRDAPEILFYPAIALALTVLGFIMLGDAVRDALDPKARKK